MAKILQPSDLAINGGKPAYTKAWRDGPFHFRSELKELEHVLAEPKLPLARGKWVMAYRHALQELYGMKYAIPVSSGTAAVHVGLFAAGVGAGDEVIVSPLTDYGSISGIFQLNAIPVFADVTADSLLMDIASVKQKITRYTRAIMPVHVGGYGVDMSGLMKLARAHKLAVVEDCAQAHLGSLRGKYLGAFGDLGIWSTNESKHIKSGEGGFVLTNNRAKARLADLFADKCYARVPGDPPTPAFPALNVRLSDMNAALAAAQLKRLPGWVAKRQRFGDAFIASIKDIPGITPTGQPKGSNPSYWWVSFQVDKELLSVDATVFCQMLSAEGIPAGARLQQYVPGWEVFRTLDKNPQAFHSYNPGRLAPGCYPLNVAPRARTTAGRIGGIRMTQHNTVGEARAAGRAVKKIVGILIGKTI